MQTYRRKPVVVQAMVFPGVMQVDKLAKFEDWLKSTKARNCHYIGRSLFLPTFQGEREAVAGDYVVYNPATGEVYPVKPNVFDNMYDAVPDATPVPAHRPSMLDRTVSHADR